MNVGAIDFEPDSNGLRKIHAGLEKKSYYAIPTKAIIVRKQRDAMALNYHEKMCICITISLGCT